MVENLEKIYNKLLIVDGSYALHRSLHVGSVFELENSKHVRTGGIFGFLRTLSNELMKNPSYYPVVCFDQGQAKRRVDADPDYKNHRERMVTENQVLTPEQVHDDYISQYRLQRNKLMEILPLFGIPCIKFVDWEGDDLMYILSKMSKDSLVLTDDRDMLQLLSEECSIRRPMADERWDLNKFIEYRGFRNIYDFVICKAVEGDGSDNIPGCCKGIGDKSINEFIRLMECFDGDFTGYPSDESSMKEFCKSHDIKYKKAYLNFNPDRFKINMELVDLNRVEVPEDIYQSIKSTISNCRSQVDYFKIMQYMADLEIREFSVDELLQRVMSRHENLYI